MKRIALTIITAALLAGCTDRADKPASATGTVRLATRFMAPQDSESEGVQDPTERFWLWISNERGLMRRYNSWADVPESITIATGSYLAEVWAGDSVPASFTKRYFKGAEEFEVRTGKPTAVNMTCRLANAVTSVEFAGNSASLLSDVRVTVANKGGEITYTGTDDSRLGYFMMASGENTLTYTLTGTAASDGSDYVQTGEITGVTGGNEYHLTITPDALGNTGAAFFTVAVDTSTIDHESEEIITLPPSMAGRGFDLSAPYFGERGKFADAIIEIAACGELKSLVVSAPDFASKLGSATTDLFAANATQIATLKNAGVESAYAYHADLDQSSCRLTIGAKLLNTLTTEGEYPVTITATDSYGKATAATLTVQLTDAPVVANAIDGTARVWATKATLHGSILKADRAATVGFRYRKADSQQWIDVAANKSGSEFTATVTGLTPGTQYEFTATAPSFVGAATRFFTTEQAAPIPNGDFESWNTSSTPYLLCASASDMFWDSGNHGSAKLNVNLTTPNSSLLHGGRYSARLASQKVSMLGIGKFAAGNAFVGKYLDTDGTDGILGFGRPFTSRPTALKGWVRYEPAKVDNSSLNEMPVGATDKGQIYVALVTGDNLEEYGNSQWPFVIKTKNAARLFDRNDPRVLAFGEKVFTETTSGSGLVEFTIPLDYRRTDIKPSYLVLVCTASYYGDYFTGGPSVMYIDDFTFEY